jgi:hypothetical protein
MTQAIVDITKRLGIAVHDHIIVGKETGPLPVGNPARPTAPAGSNRSRLLRCMSRVMMLWTAPPPARECQRWGRR